uniref:Uncharacterized protein n=1 Tax=Rousettus aegyptiacus TaxID=9407 RepID=A0A7J8HS34_ROUAE|nr:hypothetical protein HJG63_010983 [Rousettus aegyptiacus]
MDDNYIYIYIYICRERERERERAYNLDEFDICAHCKIFATRKLINASISSHSYVCVCAHVRVCLEHLQLPSFYLVSLSGMVFIFKTTENPRSYLHLQTSCHQEGQNKVGKMTATKAAVSQI